MITQAYDVFVYGAELAKEFKKILRHLPDIDDDKWKPNIICSENGKIDSIQFFSNDSRCHIECSSTEMRVFGESTSRPLYKYNGWDDIYEYKIQNTPYTPNPFDIKDTSNNQFDIKDNIEDIIASMPQPKITLDENGKIKYE